MADWIDIQDSALDPDAPVTSELAYAFRDNLKAVTEGAPGAPKVTGNAVDIGIGNLSGTNAIVGLGDVATLLLTASSQASGTDGASCSVGYQLSSDNGSTWGAEVDIASASSGQVVGVAQVSACGTSLVNMVGYNAIRLAGVGGLSGSVVCVKGV